MDKFSPEEQITIAYAPEQETKAAGYLGIAQKSAKLAAGDAAAMNALKQGKAFLLVLAADTAEKLRQEFAEAARSSNVPVVYWRDKYELGRVVGKSRRGAAAVLDQGLATAILKTFSHF